MMKRGLTGGGDFRRMEPFYTVPGQSMNDYAFAKPHRPTQNEE